MNSTRHSFTLIELLVVIVLISMLVGITVPVYTRVMTGNAVSYGMRQVVSQLNMARVEACRARRPVAVVFLMKRWATGDTVPDDKDGIYNRRAFRACYVNSSSYEFEKWIPGSKWETLPKGAFLATSTQSGFVSSNDVLYEQIKDDPPDRLFSADTTFQHAIIFDATGRPVVSSSTPQVVIAEGTINSNAPDTQSAALTDTNDNIHKPNLDNWAVCRVNRYTGKVKTEMNDVED